MNAEERLNELPVIVGDEARPHLIQMIKAYAAQARKEALREAVEIGLDLEMSEYWADKIPEEKAYNETVRKYSQAIEKLMEPIADVGAWWVTAKLLK